MRLPDAAASRRVQRASTRATIACWRRDARAAAPPSGFARDRLTPLLRDIAPTDREHFTPHDTHIRRRVRGRGARQILARERTPRCRTRGMRVRLRELTMYRVVSTGGILVHGSPSVSRQARGDLRTKRSGKRRCCVLTESRGNELLAKRPLRDPPGKTARGWGSRPRLDQTRYPGALRRRERHRKHPADLARWWNREGRASAGARRILRDDERRSRSPDGPCWR